jgi:hypothetical protein
MKSLVTGAAAAPRVDRVVRLDRHLVQIARSWCATRTRDRDQLGRSCAKRKQKGAGT